MDCDIFALLTLEDSERMAVLTYNKSKRENRWLFCHNDNKRFSCTEYREERW